MHGQNHIKFISQYSDFSKRVSIPSMAVLCSL